jgi:hypothetical protein
MATITPYVARGVYVGQVVDVKVHKLVWLKIGQGSVRLFSDQEVNIAGKVNFMGHNDNLNIHLKLMDGDSQARSGPCCLQLNSYIDERAKYRASAEKLTVFAVLGGRKQNISILPTNNGTQTACELFGHVNETVHLDPV